MSTEKNESIPVIDDYAAVEDPIADEGGDTDLQLKKDDEEAIDSANIIKERTRHASAPKGAYREPGDEEGIIPENEQDVVEGKQ